MQHRTACHALTPQGATLARSIAASLDGVVYLPRRFALEGETPFDAFAPHLAASFREHPAHVFIAAAGIVVRCLAPLLDSKTRDPAVVVCDQQGAFAISLLSGHLGGANDLAARVASLTGGRAVITTATDTAGLPSLDVVARDAGCAIRNIVAVRAVNGALLAGETVTVYDPDDLLGLARYTGDDQDLGHAPAGHEPPVGLRREPRTEGETPAGAHSTSAPLLPPTTPAGVQPCPSADARGTPQSPTAQPPSPHSGAGVPPMSAHSLASPAGRTGRPLFHHVESLDTLLALPPDSPCVAVTWLDLHGTHARLVLHPRVVHAGAGCRRGADADAVERLLGDALRLAGAAPQALTALHTVDIKADEPALQRVAAAHGVPLRCHAATVLAAIAVPNPSPKAAEVLGTGTVGVAEASALRGSGGGELIVEKIKGSGVTMALALARGATPAPTLPAASGEEASFRVVPPEGTHDGPSAPATARPDALRPTAASRESTGNPAVHDRDEDEA